MSIEEDIDNDPTTHHDYTSDHVKDAYQLFRFYAKCFAVLSDIAKAYGYDDSFGTPQAIEDAVSGLIDALLGDGAYANMLNLMDAHEEDEV